MEKLAIDEVDGGFADPFSSTPDLLPASPTPTGGPGGLAIDEVNDPAPSSVKVGVTYNPDEAAKNARLSKDSGVPMQGVEADPTQVDNQLRANQVMNATQNSPVTREFFNDPTNAKIAHDDAESMSLIERAWEANTQIPRALWEANKVVGEYGLKGLRSLGAGVLDLKQGWDDINNQLDETLGAVNPFILLWDKLIDPGFAQRSADRVNQQYQNMTASNQAVISAVRGDNSDEPWLAQQILSGVESTGTTLGAMATGNPVAALTIMGLQTEATSYKEARRAGLNPAQATAYGVEQGAVEVMTELPATKILFEGIKAGRPFSRLLTSEMVADQVGEQIATAWQDFNTWANIHPDRPFSEYIAERPNAALETAVASAAGSILQTGIIRGTAGAFLRDDAQATEGLENKEVLDTLREIALSSKFAERDPERWTQFQADAARANGMQSVFISADAIAELGNAVEGSTGRQFAESLGINTDDYAQALVLGGDVQVSMETLGGILLGDQYDAIAPHIKFERGGKSAAEAVDFKESGLVEEVERGLMRKAMAQQPDSTTNPAYDINRPEVFEALSEAGFSPQQISQMTSDDVQALFYEGKPATNEEADADHQATLAEDELGLQGLFNDAKQAGISDVDFTKYLLATAKAANKTRQRQKVKVIKEQQKRNSKEWKDAREKVRNTVEQQVLNEPVYRALEQLGGTAQDRLLDRDALIALLPDGEAGLKRIPRKDGRNIFTPKGMKGVDPEIHAFQSGFNSAESMLFSIMDAPPIGARIHEITEKQMLAQNGDLVTEQQQLAAALESAHNDLEAEVLAFELNQLRGAKKEGRIKASLVRAAAREILNSYRIEEVNPVHFIKAERKWGQQAARALRKGDRALAAAAKYKQLINHQMATEAYRAQKNITKEMNFIKQFTKQKKTWDKVDAPFMDAIKQILSDYKIGARMSAKKIKELQAKNIVTALEGRVSLEAVDQRVFDQERRKNIKDTDYGEFQEVANTIRMLYEQGKRAKEYIVNGQKRDFENLKADLLEKSANLKELSSVRKNQARLNADDPVTRAAETLRSIDAALTKVEFILQELDNGEPVGIWHQAVFQKAVDAQSKQADMMTKHFEPLIKELQQLEVKTGRKLSTKVMVGNQMGTVADLLHFALNTGNESNLKKLVEGWGKSVDGRQALSEKDIDDTLDQLTPREWKWVQKVWDTFEDIYPKVAQIYRDEHGVDPIKIEPRAFKISDGTTMRGGYFPVKYDVLRMQPGTASDRIGTDELFERFNTRTSVYSGMTKARSGFTAPILVDLNALPRMAEEIMHYVTHYDTVRDLRKLFNDPTIAKELRNKLGKEKQDELNKWVKALANPHALPPENKGWNRVLNAVRNNVVTAFIGFSATTMASQTFGRFAAVSVLGQTSEGGFNAAKGEYWLTRGYLTYTTDPKNSTKVAFEKSKEMRTRLRSVDRDVAQAIRELKGKKNYWHQAQRASLLAIGGVQLYTVDIPTWWAAYNQAIAQGKADGDAVNYADHVIRVSQGSGHVKDLTSFQNTNNPWARLFTMFSTYTVIAYNLEKQTLKNVGRKPIKNLPGAIARMAWLFIIPGILNGLMRGEPPENDEELLGWAEKQVVSYSLGSQPIFGSSLSSLYEGYDPSRSLSPAQALVDSMSQVGQDVLENMDEDEDFDSEDLKHLIRATGLAAGAPGTQQVLRALEAIEAEDDSKWYNYLIGYKD